MLDPYKTLENTHLEPFCKFSEKIESLMCSVAYEGVSEDTEYLNKLNGEMLAYYSDCFSEVGEKKKILGGAKTPAQIYEVTRITLLYQAFAHSVRTAVLRLSKGENLECVSDSLEQDADSLIKEVILN